MTPPLLSLFLVFALGSVINAEEEQQQLEKDLTNKEVLVKFLSYRLRNQEKKARMSISYVTLLTKTLIDQTEEMKKLR